MLFWCLFPSWPFHKIHIYFINTPIFQGYLQKYTSRFTESCKKLKTRAPIMCSIQLHGWNHLAPWPTTPAESPSLGTGSLLCRVQHWKIWSACNHNISWRNHQLTFSGSNKHRITDSQKEKFMVNLKIAMWQFPQTFYLLANFKANSSAIVNFFATGAAAPPPDTKLICRYFTS